MTRCLRLPCSGPDQRSWPGVRSCCSTLRCLSLLGTRAYDIAPDGRFLVIRSGQAEAGGGTPSNMIVVLNWAEELKRLVPRN